MDKFRDRRQRRHSPHYPGQYHQWRWVNLFRARSYRLDGRHSWRAPRAAGLPDHHWRAGRHDRRSRSRDVERESHRVERHRRVEYPADTGRASRHPARLGIRRAAVRDHVDGGERFSLPQLRRRSELDAVYGYVRDVPRLRGPRLGHDRRKLIDYVQIDYVARQTLAWVCYACRSAKLPAGIRLRGCIGGGDEVGRGHYRRATILRAASGRMRLRGGMESGRAGTADRRNLPGHAAQIGDATAELADGRGKRPLSGSGRNPKRVMAAAYAYAEGGGPMSHEIELAWQINRFGAQAVMGRHYLDAAEIRRMTAAGNVLKAYRSRED